MLSETETQKAEPLTASPRGKLPKYRDRKLLSGNEMYAAMCATGKHITKLKRLYDRLETAQRRRESRAESMLDAWNTDQELAMLTAQIDMDMTDWMKRTKPVLEAAEGARAYAPIVKAGKMHMAANMERAEETEAA